MSSKRFFGKNPMNKHEMVDHVLETRGKLNGRYSQEIEELLELGIVKVLDVS